MRSWHKAADRAREALADVAILRGKERRVGFGQVIMRHNEERRVGFGAEMREQAMVDLDGAEHLAAIRDDR